MTNKQRLCLAGSAFVIALGFFGRPSVAMADGPDGCNGSWQGCMYNDYGTISCPDDYTPNSICNNSWDAWGCPRPANVNATTGCEYTTDCYDANGFDHGAGIAAECTGSSKQ